MGQASLPPGFILVNKPAGWTSFDVVNYVRKAAVKKCHPEEVPKGRPKDLSVGDLDSSATPQNDKPKRLPVGHAGTLDPFATGLLIVGIGRDATKQLDSFKNLPKTYVASLHLGATSDTGDVTGRITLTNSPATPSVEEITKVLASLTGEQKQIPPMYSAKSVGGTRLYKLARQGQTVERQPSTITIHSLKLIRTRPMPAARAASPGPACCSRSPPAWT